MRRFREQILGITRLLCGILIGGLACAADGVKPIVTGCAIDDQLNFYRRISSLVVEYDELDEIGTCQTSLVAKGVAYRYASRAVREDKGGEKGGKGAGNRGQRQQSGPRHESFMYSYSPKLRQFLDLETGSMDLSRAILPIKPGESRCFGKQTPSVLSPLAFLAWKDQLPWGESFHWGDLANDELIKARIKLLVRQEKGADDDERILLIDYKTLEVDATGNQAQILAGWYAKLVLKRQPAFAGAFLVQEEQIWRKGMPQPLARAVFTYRSVAAADGSGVFPIPELVVRGSLEPLVPIRRLTKVEVNGRIDDADIEIDPTLAKSITDLDTKMRIEPQ